MNIDSAINWRLYWSSADMVGTYTSESIYKHQNKEKYLPPEPMEAFLVVHLFDSVLLFLFFKCGCVVSQCSQINNRMHGFFMCVSPKVVGSLRLSCILKIGKVKIFWTALRTLKTRNKIYGSQYPCQKIIKTPKSNPSKQLWIKGLSIFGSQWALKIENNILGLLEVHILQNSKHFLDLSKE